MKQAAGREIGLGLQARRRQQTSFATPRCGLGLAGSLHADVQHDWEAQANKCIKIEGVYSTGCLATSSKN